MGIFKVELEIYPHEKDVTCIYKHLQEMLPAWKWNSISIGWCGWANNVDCWWIRVRINRKQVIELLTWINDQNLELCVPIIMD